MLIDDENVLRKPLNQWLYKMVGARVNASPSSTAHTKKKKTSYTLRMFVSFFASFSFCFLRTGVSKHVARDMIKSIKWCGCCCCCCLLFIFFQNNLTLCWNHRTGRKTTKKHTHTFIQRSFSFETHSTPRALTTLFPPSFLRSITNKTHFSNSCYCNWNNNCSW